MITVKGLYNEATILCPNDPTENPDDPDYANMRGVISQVESLCNQESMKGTVIKIMPDTHPGKGCPIGFTMSMINSVLPNLVGVDIGCGMSMLKLGKIKKEFDKLDTVVKENIPVGFKHHEKPLKEALVDFDSAVLHCADDLDKRLIYNSLGTLGGGNHFIEIDKSEDNEYYLIVHSGSRSLGLQVNDIYMKAGYEALKEEGINNVPYELTYLTGELAKNYIHDTFQVQQYAELNRKLIIKYICKNMKWKYTEDEIASVPHNYLDIGPIDTWHSLSDPFKATSTFGIIRKGAISAIQDEAVIIPVNMRDGVILGYGKGNVDWNYSAPHGAGRVSSRKEVAEHHTVNEFKKEMEGIHSVCIGKDTLDEAPFAYRNLEYVLKAIEDTVTVTKILKPVYNYKGGGKS